MNGDEYHSLTLGIYANDTHQGHRFTRGTRSRDEPSRPGPVVCTIAFDKRRRIDDGEQIWPDQATLIHTLDDVWEEPVSLELNASANGRDGATGVRIHVLVYM